MKPKKDKPIVIDPKDVYKVHYRLRRTGADGASFETTLPKQIIEKAARDKGASIKEFLEKYMVEISYNSFRGLHIDFVDFVQE